MPEQFASPYASRFAATYRVNTAHDLYAWTETHEVEADMPWLMTFPDDATFVAAVPTPSGLVGFFAATPEDAARIRQSVL